MQDKAFSNQLPAAISLKECKLFIKQKTGGGAYFNRNLVLPGWNSISRRKISHYEGSDVVGRRPIKGWCGLSMHKVTEMLTMDWNLTRQRFIHHYYVGERERYKATVVAADPLLVVQVKNMAA